MFKRSVKENKEEQHKIEILSFLVFIIHDKIKLSKNKKMSAKKID